MPRSHARVMCSIWRDPDFIALPAVDQRMYLLLLSQPDLSLCGALVLKPKRWARLCPEDTIESVMEAVRRLSARGYIMFDEETDELWVRSFIRYDGILKNSKMLTGMWSAFEQLYSDEIRGAFYEAYVKAIGKGDGIGDTNDDDIRDGKGAEWSGSGVEKAAPKNRFNRRCPNCRLMTGIDCVCPSVRAVPDPKGA